MSKNTKNHKLFKYEDNDNADLTFLNDTMDIIDGGLTLDVGTSTGTGNNYILNIGSITLSSSNKGISFKFFADKDSTGAVTINTNYNLIKPNKNPVKNLKSGAPYIITYDGGSNFFLASGTDEADSTSVGTDGSNVKTGITFVGTDGEIHTGVYTADGTMVASDLLSGKVGYSKGNKITGAMVNREAPTAALNCGGTYNLAEGYYSGGKVTANSLASQTPANATAKQILSGYTAWVNGSKLTGTATIETLGGKKINVKTVTINPKNSTTYDVGFTIKYVLFGSWYYSAHCFYDVDNVYGSDYGRTYVYDGNSIQGTVTTSGSSITITNSTSSNYWNSIPVFCIGE